MKKVISQLVILGFLSSCGTDGGSSSEPTADNRTKEDETLDPTAALFIAKGEDKPECKQKRHLIYLEEESSFQVCDGKEWKKVDLKQSTTNNTTTVQNNYGQSVFVDDVYGYEWHLVFNVQEKNVEKKCPSGTTLITASEAENEFVTAKVGFFLYELGQKVGAAYAAVWVRQTDGTLKVGQYYANTALLNNSSYEMRNLDFVAYRAVTGSGTDYRYITDLVCLKR